MGKLKFLFFRLFDQHELSLFLSFPLCLGGSFATNLCAAYEMPRGQLATGCGMEGRRRGSHKQEADI